MPKPWEFQRSKLFETQPYKRAFEINDVKAKQAGGCWSTTDYCDDTHCPCADKSLAQAKKELQTQ